MTLETWRFEGHLPIYFDHLHSFARFRSVICHRQYSMMAFAPHFQMRVGEAANPGPNQVRLCVTNPTAIFKKVSDILKFQGQLIMASETSATSAVQNSVQQEFKKAEFQSFWSLPTESKIPTEDGRPSFRGEALGTAIFTSLPARKARVQIPLPLLNSTRFCCNITRFGTLEVLVIAIYGFQKKMSHGVKLNDTLLTYVFQLIHEVGLPYIIGGDFNEPVDKLPIYQAFKDDGAVEMFAWYQAHMNCQLPPTCNGVTRNDTMIMHPLLAQRIVAMQVDKKHQIDPHVPLFVDIVCHYDQPQRFTWNIPKSWAHIAPPKELLHEEYETCRSTMVIPDHFDSAEHAEKSLIEWSRAVEKSVDKALQRLHRTDPFKNPVPCLAGSYKGRCCPQQRKPVSSPSTVKNDRHQGYQPPSEVFSEKNKQKIRQVRRIKSLLRALKSSQHHGRLSDDMYSNWQLNNEWNAICRARGFGNRWDTWILSFDLVPYVPSEVPEYNYLELMGHITEFDCDCSCKYETTQRRANFQNQVRIDNSENFGKMTYRIMKAKSNPSLDEVPYRLRTAATLLRSVKGQQQIKIAEYIHIQSGSHVFFGDATICVTNQHECIVSFRIVAGNVPSHADLVIPKIAITSEEIAVEFQRFWAPMWLRDSPQEQFQADTGKDFLHDLDTTPIPQMSVPISLDDCRLWERVIKGLDHKSHGICGWRHEELKAIPSNSIADLANIMSKLVRVGFTESMMSAKTILLAKNSDPQSMHDGRPITILSALYRLLGKVIFRQVADYWAGILPLPISGGLPGRGVKDIAYAQKYQIESCLSTGQQLGGFSLDLIKAFNTFGRYPLAKAMQRLGIPSFLTDFWVLCLSKMRRFLYHKSSLSQSFSSTTGVPEGCSLSVLSMISLSSVFYYRIAGEGIFPWAYADNWSWFTKTQKAHFKTYIQMLNLVHSLKLCIDFNKSWHWGTTKSFREGCADFELLFPNQAGKVTIRTAVKDLGERVIYNKSVSLGFIKDKFQEAVQRIGRLSHIPTTLANKMLKAQMAAWSVATYSADTTFVGPRHFHELRKAILYMVVGSKQGASPWLCCMNLSSFLHDPLLHVLCNIVRTLGRLHRCQPALASDIVSMASTYTGMRPYGPATSFKRYLTLIDWDIQPDGTLTGPEHFRCNIFTDSTRDCVACLRQAWPLFVIQQINRKGIGDFNLHPSITRDVFQTYSNEEQLLLTHNLLGAFQSEKQKAIWAEDCQGLCKLCNAEDTKEHRLLECPKLEPVRQQFPEAVRILKQCRPEWIHIPCARQHPDAMIHRAMMQHLHNSELNNMPDLTHTNVVKFYTDGGCIHPTDPMARLASWSVVMEHIPENVNPDDIQHTISCQNPSSTTWSPCHTVLGLGLVKGKQTAGRGEIQSVLHAARLASAIPAHISSVITTDAQYVCNIVKQIELDSYKKALHKKANPDLVSLLADVWDKNRFSIRKIKSHRHFASAVSTDDFWQVLGNHCADIAASTALAHAPAPLLIQAKQIFEFHQKEKLMLQKVLDFLIALNRLRIQVLHEQDQIDPQLQY